MMGWWVEISDKYEGTGNVGRGLSDLGQVSAGLEGACVYRCVEDNSYHV